MAKYVLYLAAMLSFAVLPANGVLLFADNFDAPDTNNLDLSDQAGRRSGLNTAIQVRSSRIQHGIAGNQLDFLNNRTGRIRFHEDLDNDNTTAGEWHDWASGVTGTQILLDGGVRVEFDWIAGNDTSGNWISMNIGHNGSASGEPNFRVNDASNDIGILFRFNGATQVFDNGADQVGGSFAPTIGLRHVRLDYEFDSFADGTPVTMTAWVDGTEVYNSNTFNWEDNGGQLYMELGNLESTRIDNVMISTIPEPTTASLFGIGGALLLMRRRRR